MKAKTIKYILDILNEKNDALCKEIVVKKKANETDDEFYEMIRRQSVLSEAFDDFKNHEWK